MNVNKYSVRRVNLPTFSSFLILSSATEIWNFQSLPARFPSVPTLVHFMLLLDITLCSSVTYADTN